MLGLRIRAGQCTRTSTNNEGSGESAHMRPMDIDKDSDQIF